MAEAQEPPFWAPWTPGVSLGSLKPDQIAMRDKHFNIDFLNSPKRSPAPTKSGAPCNFCFKCQNEWLRLLYLRTPFTHPIPPRTFPPLRTTSMPNFILIRPAVWISIETDRQTDTQTHKHCPLCIRFNMLRFFEAFETYWSTKDTTVTALPKFSCQVIFLNCMRQDYLPSLQNMTHLV